MKHLFVVGSNNPVKINAVKLALQPHFSTSKVAGYEVESGVSEQPRSDAETRRGARNRAKAVWQQALRSSAVAHSKIRVVGIGIEGGILIKRNHEVWSVVWVSVTSDGQHFFDTSGARFQLPEHLAAPLREGGELGPIMSQLHAGKDIKRLNGAIGVLTHDYVDRTSEYACIAKLSLGLWYGAVAVVT